MFYSAWVSVILSNLSYIEQRLVTTPAPSRTTRLGYARASLRELETYRGNDNKSCLNGGGGLFVRESSPDGRSLFLGNQFLTTPVRMREGGGVPCTCESIRRTPRARLLADKDVILSEELSSQYGELGAQSGRGQYKQRTTSTRLESKKKRKILHQAARLIMPGQTLTCPTPFWTHCKVHLLDVDTKSTIEKKKGGGRMKRKNN